LILQPIFSTIISYIKEVYLNTPNLAEILGLEVTKFPGVLLSFIDVFMIWYFIVVSIGLAKINHSGSTTKYFLLTFGFWIGISLILVAFS
jgi:hypothetical protein